MIMKMSCVEINNALNQYLRPDTFPIGIKIYADDKDLPERMKIPSKDFGEAVTICQGISMVRKIGWTIGFFQNDTACPNAQLALGYVKEPDFVKDGSLLFPMYAKDEETAVKTHELSPRMPNGDTHCIVMGPLDRIAFAPDIILVYGNPAQIIRLVQGALFYKGGFINSRIFARVTCASYITEPYLKKECNVVIPDTGERIFGQTQDHELLFAVPQEKIDEVIDGLIKTHKSGVARYPIPGFGLQKRPGFPDKYAELERYCGLKQ